jgi:hypothetical protein
MHCRRIGYLSTAAGVAGFVIHGVGFLRHPPLSFVVAQGEYAMPALILFWSVVGIFFSWGSRIIRRKRRAGALRQLLRGPERAATVHLRRWGAVYALALPMLTLLCIWAAPEGPSAAGGYCALFGQLPWSDARGYFDGAHHLLATGQLDDWNCRRPVNVALLAVRLGLTNGNAHGAVILQVLLLGITVYLCARAMGSEFGIWAGLAAYALTWCWIRPYFPTTMTETLGVSLGALSFALLFKGMRRGTATLLMVGLFGMAFAQATRMGVLIILPMLLAWVGWRYRPRRIVAAKYVGISLLALVLGFSTNFILVRAYGNKDMASVGSNFAHTIHGLAADSPDAWTYYQRFDELKRLPEAQLNKRLYHDAWEMIRRDPRPLMHALWDYNLRPFFLNFRDHVFSDLYFWDRNAFFYFRTMTWIVLCLGLLLYLVRERTKGDLSFWFMGTAGFLLSVPIIYQNSGWRAMAATYPWLAGLLSCGLSLPYAPKRKVGSTSLEWRTSWLLAGVWILSICGPAVATRFSTPVIVPPFNDVSDNEAIIAGGNVMRSTAVLSGTRPIRGVTAFNDETLRLLLKKSSMEIREELDTKLPRSKPYMLAVVYDYSHEHSIYIIAPPGLVDEERGYLRLRLLPLNVIEHSLGNDQHVFEVLEWRRIR